MMIGSVLYARICPMKSLSSRIASNRLCGPCVKYLKRNNSQPTCPGDHLSIEPLFVDHFYRREMQHKKCHCVFRVNGCQWNSTVKDLNNHEEKCDFRDVTCPDCEATMMLANLQLHRENVCVNRMGSCESVRN